jgi:pre-rRNA-processing protein TSR3
MSAFRPTVIVVHPREKRRKCTVEPLRGRPEFVFRKFPAALDIAPENYVRLGLDGPLLGPDDADKGLLVLDGTWRLAAQMDAAYAQFPARTLPLWKTAYPRSSKVRVDPDVGLATIEAIYLAHHLLGRPTEGLLDHYHWAAEFLELNHI